MLQSAPAVLIPVDAADPGASLRWLEGATDGLGIDTVEA